MSLPLSGFHPNLSSFLAKPSCSVDDRVQVNVGIISTPSTAGVEIKRARGEKRLWSVEIG